MHLADQAVAILSVSQVKLKESGGMLPLSMPLECTKLDRRQTWLENNYASWTITDGVLRSGLIQGR